MPCKITTAPPNPPPAGGWGVEEPQNTTGLLIRLHLLLILKLFNLKENQKANPTPQQEGSLGSHVTFIQFVSLLIG